MEVQRLETRQMLSAANFVDSQDFAVYEDGESPFGEFVSEYYSLGDELYWQPVPGAVSYEVVITNLTSGEQLLHETTEGMGNLLPTNKRSLSLSFDSGNNSPEEFEIAIRPIGENGAVGDWGRTTHSSTPVGSYFRDDNGTVSAQRFLILINVTGRSGGFSNSEFERTPLNLSGPAGDSRTATPTISWNATAGADHYEIQVYDVDAGRMIQQHGRTELSFTLPPLDAGNYQVFVRAVDGSGQNGEWGHPLEFHVAATDGVAAENTALQGPELSARQISGRTHLTWSGDPQADHFELLIYNKETGEQVVHRDNLLGNEYRVEELAFHVADLDGFSAPSTTHQAFVRSISADGQPSQWSNPVEFEATGSVVDLITLFNPVSVETLDLGFV